MALAATPDTTAVITAWGTVLAAVAALVVSCLTFWQLLMARQARFDAHQPIICPVEMLPDMTTLTVRNIGPGVATNIIATICAPDVPGAGRDGTYRFVCRFDAPMVPGDTAKATLRELKRDELTSRHIATWRAWYSLMLPEYHGDYVWRVVITYHDIFRRTHASIFDGRHYSANSQTMPSEWHTHALLSGVLHDLDALLSESITAGTDQRG